MFYASDYRAMARKSLAGKWPMAIGVCILGMILGAVSTESPIQIKYGSGSEGVFGIHGYEVKIFGYTWGSTYISHGILGLITLAALIIVIIGLIRFIIGSAVQLGMCTYFSKSALGISAGIEDEFSHFDIFFKALGLRFMMALFTALWAILFIIPGIVAAYRYSMAPYIMAEHPEIGVFEAINQSKEIMNGKKANKFCLDLSFIGWSILSTLTLGIGYIFLSPYMQMAEAHFYISVTRQTNYM